VSNCTGFDQVAVKKASGYNRLEAEEFLALPLKERVRLILERQAEFLKNGEIFPATEALRHVPRRAETR
jgi:hypothetical protein